MPILTLFVAAVPCSAVCKFDAESLVLLWTCVREILKFAFLIYMLFLHAGHPVFSGWHSLGLFPLLPVAEAAGQSHAALYKCAIALASHCLHVGDKCLKGASQLFVQRSSSWRGFCPSVQCSGVWLGCVLH